MSLLGYLLTAVIMLAIISLALIRRVKITQKNIHSFSTQSLSVADCTFSLIKDEAILNITIKKNAHLNSRDTNIEVLFQDKGQGIDFKKKVLLKKDEEVRLFWIGFYTAVLLRTKGLIIAKLQKMRLLEYAVVPWPDDHAFQPDVVLQRGKHQVAVNLTTNNEGQPVLWINRQRQDALGEFSPCFYKVPDTSLELHVMLHSDITPKRIALRLRDQLHGGSRV